MKTSMQMLNFPFNKNKNKIISTSDEETFRCGSELAAAILEDLTNGDSACGSGAVIFLNGPLGAGKTVFTKGLAAGFGINENITSPTYSIIQEYTGKVCFYHIDAYRLSGFADFEAAGGMEYIERTKEAGIPPSVCVIEWSERLEGELQPTLTVTIEIPKDAKNPLLREIRFS